MTTAMDLFCRKCKLICRYTDTKDGTTLVYCSHCRTVLELREAIRAAFRYGDSVKKGGLAGLWGRIRLRRTKIVWLYTYWNRPKKHIHCTPDDPNNVGWFVWHPVNWDAAKAFERSRRQEQGRVRPRTGVTAEN